MHEVLVIRLAFEGLGLKDQALISANIVSFRMVTYGAL
jgi:hypothetical protein